MFTPPLESGPLNPLGRRGPALKPKLHHQGRILELRRLKLSDVIDLTEKHFKRKLDAFTALAATLTPEAKQAIASRLFEVRGSQSLLRNSFETFEGTRAALELALQGTGVIYDDLELLFDEQIQLAYEVAGLVEPSSLTEDKPAETPAPAA